MRVSGSLVTASFLIPYHKTPDIPTQMAWETSLCMHFKHLQVCLITSGLYILHWLKIGVYVFESLPVKEEHVHCALSQWKQNIWFGLLILFEGAHLCDVVVCGANQRTQVFISQSFLHQMKEWALQHTHIHDQHFSILYLPIINHQFKV